MPPVVEALLLAATADPVEYVRSDAIVLLSRHREASARIDETFGQIAEHDVKPAIRRLAHDALGSFPR